MAKTNPDTPATTDDEKKLEAFNTVTRTIAPLTQADKYAVLNAAAKFHGFGIRLDVNERT